MNISLFIHLPGLILLTNLLFFVTLVRIHLRGLILLTNLLFL